MTKRALLVGCNYPGTTSELWGCINDVHSMFAMLTGCYGFEPNKIQCLTDENPRRRRSALPTGTTIKNALKRLVAASRPGDVLLFHFSGHGTQVVDVSGGEVDRMDEAIVPTDFNIITDDDLRGIFSALSPEVKFTMVSDCCHSGSMLDHPHQQIYGNKDPNAPAGVSGMDQSAVKAKFFKGIPASSADDVTQRSRQLPQSTLHTILRDRAAAAAAAAEPVHQLLLRVFGNDASVSSRRALGLPDSPPTILGRFSSLFSSLFTGIFSSPAAPQDPATEAPAVPTDTPAATQKDVRARGPGGEAKVACGVLVTGCQANETSADACPSGDPSKAFGALTNALTTTVHAVKDGNPGASMTCKDVVLDVRAVLYWTNFTQNPCLECRDHDVASPFVC